MLLPRVTNMRRWLVWGAVLAATSTAAACGSGDESDLGSGSGGGGTSNGGTSSGGTSGAGAGGATGGSAGIPSSGGTAGIPATGGASGTGATGGTGGGTAASVRFVAIGDAGKGNAEQKQVADAIQAKCAASGCDFVQLLGDNIYDSGVASVTDPQ